MKTRMLVTAGLLFGLFTRAIAEDAAQGVSAARGTPSAAVLPSPPVVYGTSPQSEAPPRAASRQEHLRQAAQHLEAAGLAPLAEHVRSLAHHSPDNARAAVPAKDLQQVMVSLTVLEVDAAKLRNLGFDLPKTGITLEYASRGPWATVDGRKTSLDKMLEALQRDRLASVLGRPQIVTLMDQPAHIQIGGAIPLWALGPDGKPVQKMGRTGLLLDLVPHPAVEGKIRLDVRWEFAEADPSKTVRVAGKENPVIHRWGIDTAVEAPLGETAILASPIPRDGAKPSSDRLLIMLLRPELFDHALAAKYKQPPK